MVMCNEKNALEKTGEKNEQNDCRPRTWEDLCRKKLSYAEYLLWKRRRNHQSIKKRHPRSVLRFFALFFLFEDTKIPNEAARRICFDWYIFIGCVCAKLTPISFDRVYVVDLS
jgi:hypothetical protein